MSLDQKVGLFTTAMRNEFYTSFDAVPTPAPWEKWVQKIPSTARIEHYAWMSPTPGISQYRGHRRFGKIDTIRYSVLNLEFDAGFSVLLRDIEDDQTGGYEMKPRELSDRAAVYPSKATIKLLAAGGANLCYDGSNFFGSTHNIGTINNTIAFTSTGSSDGLTFKLAALYTGGRLKPVLWQDRKPPRFDTDAGEAVSRMAKEVKYWIDFEGQAAFGWPHDAVLVTITNTPNVTDMHAIFQKIANQMRAFTLPKALGTDDAEYPHEQTEFNESNMMLIGAVGLENQLRNALTLQLIAQQIGANTVGVNNNFQGWASYIISNLMV